MIVSKIYRLSLLLSLFVACTFLVWPNSAAAQCKDSDPVGSYTGSATSTQAGVLDITLNLKCEKGDYAGSMNTSVGTYTVVSGSFQAGILKLDLVYAGNHIAVELKRSGDEFEGTFSSADDSGPVKLHRSGAATQSPKQK